MNENNQLDLWEEKNSIEQKMNYENKNDCATNDIMSGTEKNSIEKDSKDITLPSGIYKITNKTNNKYYIGSSRSLHRRWVEHKNKLKKNKHHCRHLQFAWNMYGENAFEFEVIRRVPLEVLFVEEQKEMDKYNKELLYNSCFTAGGSDFWKGKIGKKSAMFGVKRSKETVERIRQSKLGKNNPNYGTHRTDAFKKLMREKISDKKIYQFVNIYTNETFTGTRIAFESHAGVPSKKIYKLINLPNRKTKSGWKLLQPPESH